MLNFIAQWRSERVAVRELTRLPDQRLADLGIARDIKSGARAAASTVNDGVPGSGVSARRTDPVGVMAPSWANHNRRALA